MRSVFVLRPKGTFKIMRVKLPRVASVFQKYAIINNMKTSLRILAFLICISAFISAPALAQSKEQREAAKDHPFTLRVNAGQDESKRSSKSKGGRNRSQTKSVEKVKHWTAEITSPTTNITEKIELRAYYIGTEDGAFAIIGKDKYPVAFSDKGRATVEIASPVAKLVRTTKQVGSRRNNHTEKTTTGERINGLVLQLWVDGTIVKTYASQSAWAKAAWTPDLSEEHLKPNASKTHTL